MHARFHAPDAQHPEQLIALPSEEATHATRVLRLKAGDEVRVFDGRGHEFIGAIERATKSAVDVRLLRAHDAAPERRVSITLVQAVLKGDKTDEVIRDAVMMGVTAIVPLVSARTEVSLSTLERVRRRERWERIAIVSAKQCGRAVVPTIADACDVTALCSELSVQPRGPAFVFVEPSAVAGRTVDQRQRDPGSCATAIIGPEGGWTPEEVAHLSAVAQPITLSGPTLRADAMAVVALSVLFARWGEL